MSATKKSNNNSILMVFVITAALVFPVGYFVGDAGNEDDKVESTHVVDTSKSESIKHDHSMMEVELENAPEISNLKVIKDAKSGWNVSFDVTNFEFTPENASGEHVDSEGHAHIFVDGVKITRLYSNNYYLSDLDEGTHTVKVTLNTNDHKTYTVNGAAIEASTTITDNHHVDDPESVPHEH